MHRTYLMRDDPGRWHRRERASLGLIGGRAVQLGYAAKAHPELEAPVTFPGPFVDASATPLQRRRLAPKLGEHNTEIYVDELGLTPAELDRLRRIGAI